MNAYERLYREALEERDFLRAKLKESEAAKEIERERRISLEHRVVEYEKRLEPAFSFCCEGNTN